MEFAIIWLYCICVGVVFKPQARAFYSGIKIVILRFFKGYPNVLKDVHSKISEDNLMSST